MALPTRNGARMTNDPDDNFALAPLPAVLTVQSPVPSDHSPAAVYLASDEANYVHGATIPVDGGASAV